MTHLRMNETKESHHEFLPTERKRPMLVTYKLSDFKEVDRREDIVIFEHDLERIQPFPSYVVIQ